MVLHTNLPQSYLLIKIEKFWLTFKGEILASNNKEWKEEDYLGKSYSQWITMQYYNMLYLIILIYLDIKQTTQKNNWYYYENKYNLSKIQKCLACNGIDLNKALAIFGFPFNNITQGIQSTVIQNTFIVEGISTTPVFVGITTTQLLELANKPKACINNLNKR